MCKLHHWLALTALIGAVSSHAAEFKDLYQAKVTASAKPADWQRSAMSAVLVRLTGSESVLTQPAIAAQLAQSGNYVTQFQNIREQGTAMLQVTLDAQKLNQLLQSQQIPLWGPRRPDVLLWLTERLNDQPLFVQSPEHPLRQALQQQAQKYGLSLLFPQYDVQDTSVVNEAAAWAGDWQVLANASTRYHADQVQNLLFDQTPDPSGTLLYRLTYQAQQGAEIVTKELTHVDAMQLAAQFCAELAAQQVAQYAVNLTGDALGQSQLTLTVENVASLSDVAALQQLVGSMLTVKSVHVVQYQVGTAQLAIELAATPTDFYRAVSLVKQLQPLEPLVEVAPATAPAELTSGGVAPTASTPAELAAAEGVAAPAEEQVMVDAKTQQSLQQELLSETQVTSAGQNAATAPAGAENSAVPADGALPATGSVLSVAPVTGTQVVETNHYRLNRS